jgi:hypothetical protein
VCSGAGETEETCDDGSRVGRGERVEERRVEQMNRQDVNIISKVSEDAADAARSEQEASVGRSRATGCPAL